MSGIDIRPGDVFAAPHARIRVDHVALGRAFYRTTEGTRVGMGIAALAQTLERDGWRLIRMECPACRREVRITADGHMLYQHRGADGKTCRPRIERRGGKQEGNRS